MAPQQQGARFMPRPGALTPPFRGRTRGSVEKWLVLRLARKVDKVTLEHLAASENKIVFCTHADETQETTGSFPGPKAGEKEQHNELVLAHSPDWKNQCV